MKVIIRNLLPIFCILSLTYANAESIRIKSRFVTARGGETLQELLVKKVGIPKKLLSKKGYLNKILSWNPSLTPTTRLLPGEQVYIEIPYDLKLKPYTLIKKKKRIVRHQKPKSEIKIDKKEYKENKDRIGRWSPSIFYTFSSGQFQETIPESSISTQSNQDSPVTLGLALFNKFSKNWSFSASAYFSKLNSSVSEIGETVNIPWEYGTTTYLGYMANWMPVEVYGGIDHERFSSYNTEELPSGAALETREHNITYYTGGISKVFKLWNKQFMTKASYSKSFMTSESRPSKVTPISFEGSKFMLYLNMKYNQDWFFHLFYKQHTLTGPTELIISRVGFGFGYKL